MSYINSGLLSTNLSYDDDDEVCLPTISGNPQKDLPLLHTLDREVLLALCGKNSYVFKLCNKDPILYKMITAPQPLV
jgi:hypothetical protein